MVLVAAGERPLSADAGVEADSALAALIAGTTLVQRQYVVTGRDLPFMVTLNVLRELDVLLVHAINEAARSLRSPLPRANASAEARLAMLLAATACPARDRMELRALGRRRSNMERFTRPASSGSSKARLPAASRETLASATALYLRLVMLLRSSVSDVLTA